MNNHKKTPIKRNENMVQEYRNTAVGAGVGAVIGAIIAGPIGAAIVGGLGGYAGASYDKKK